MAELPGHEKLKRELVNKFKSDSKYDGNYIRKMITETDFKQLRERGFQKPLTVKKGDVIVVGSGKKIN